MRKRVVLEKSAEEVSSIPPLIFNHPVKEGHKKLEDAVYKYDVNISNLNFNTLQNGIIKVFLLSSKKSNNIPNINYIYMALVGYLVVFIPRKN